MRLMPLSGIEFTLMCVTRWVLQGKAMNVVGLQWLIRQNLVPEHGLSHNGFIAQCRYFSRLNRASPGKLPLKCACRFQFHQSDRAQIR